jgi:hypothetical protein
MRGWFGLLVVWFAVVALALGAAPAANAAPRVTTAAPNSSLSAVQCPSARSCLAVGQYGTSVFEYNSLAEHWNGTAWATEASPTWLSTGVGIYVTGLSCASEAVCWAVGDYLTPEDLPVAFAMRWNGTTWQLGNPPDPVPAANAFESMYCLSTLYCLAAGYDVNNDGVSTPLVENYSVTPKVGVRWLVLTIPTPAGANFARLTAITCNGAKHCNAVGDYQNPEGVYVTFAEHWDGSSWKLVRTANPAGTRSTYLTGLACTSRTGCMAVGYYKDSALLYRTVVEKWNGTRWTLVPSVSRGVSDTLNSIACSGPTSCFAVGEGSSSRGEVALVERWNGSRWSVSPIPSPGTSGQLNGVACSGTTSCMAVGSDINSAGVSVTLAEHWNGSIWSLHPTPNG